jgi:hemerythrin-like domain-containing protein
MIDQKSTRRNVVAAAAAGAGVWLIGSAARGAKSSPKEEEISPNEDLMREHGILERILLIYEEGLRRLAAKQEMAPDAIGDSAAIVRKFIEDYHEKLEEEFLFPRFEKAGRLGDLVATLRRQHQAGRQLTDATQKLSTSAAMNEAATREQLVAALQSFIRMYRPHAAREDTVLFPAFHSVVSAREYKALGEQFEDKEHQLFGKDGFEKILDEVAQIERRLGVDDLNRFTPA